MLHFRPHVMSCDDDDDDDDLNDYETGHCNFTVNSYRK
jgi:hypothetical protein